MPSRDLLNELIMFDKQPEIEVDAENIEHDDSNNEVLEKKNQETQVSFIEAMPSICRFCGSSVTPTYINIFKEVETTPTDNSLQIHKENSVKSEAVPHIVDNASEILSNNEKNSASIQVSAYPSVSLTAIQEFEDVESNTQRALFIDRIEPEADSSATCGAKISPIDEATCSELIESVTSIAQEAPTSEHVDSKKLQTSTENVIGDINVPTTLDSKNVLNLNKSDFEISIPEEPSGNVESRSSEVAASAILENHEQPLKTLGGGYEDSSDDISTHVQYLDVATQVSESLLIPWSKIDAATQTTDISTSRVPSESDNKLFSPPTRPTTQPPPGLMALSLSPIRVDMSSLRIADEIDFSKNPKAHQAVSHKRPPIPAAMLLRATPSMEIASDDSKMVNDRCNSDRESIATENSIGHDQVVASCPKRDSSTCTPTSIASTGPNYPASASSARGMDTLSTYVTDSSLVSAEESWLNRRRTFSADPGIIHAITQAMIGDLMWKYTRRVIGTGISEKKHMRYFWIHPYTNTINWSIEQPGPDRVIGDINSNFKSACVRSIQVVQDPSTDANASEFSLIIQTATRELKIKALSKEKHDIWLLALTYLQSRHGLSTPTAQRSIHNLNEADQESPSHRRTHPSTPSKTLDGLAPVPRNVSKKRSLVRLFHKPSKSSLSSSTVDAKNASNDIAIDEDIRKCCDGKHDLRKLDMKHS
ncbi:hypothetical protein K7432_012748 [Basidiobolus ranarum]|uniref:Pleckstrin homology domain-containing protein n=1 Tax=Basidiobolus ranarum TaxID=34480 RepID=A0ABR2VRU0_9FUNG